MHLRHGKPSIESNLVVEVDSISKTYNLADSKIGWRKLVDSIFQFRSSHSLLASEVLKGVSFNVKKGESLGIIGLNGSGKSTLLQIITQTVQPDEGSLKTVGRIAALLELGSGFNSEFTGRENVYLNASLFGLSEKETSRRFGKIEAFADIGTFIDQPVKTYSTGMALRLAFSIIVNIDPEILIIDEALAVGDAIFIQKCMRFLREFKKKGTLILVSHDLTAVKSLCDQCLWLHQGAVKMNASVKNVTEKYLAYILEEQKQEFSSKNYEEEKKVKVNLKSTCFSPYQVFNFHKNIDNFGSKKAIIEKYQLFHAKSKDPIKFLTGLEPVTLRVLARFQEEVTNPIVGFFVRDRLGQDLLGDNSWHQYKDSNVIVSRDCILSAEFNFIMPRLPQGEYGISLAIAQGDEKTHSILHWIHDAMFIRSVGPSPPGLVGIPMENIVLKVEE